MREKFVVRKNTKDNDNWLIDFYYSRNGKEFYMFSQNYTDGVYDWFKYGRSEGELRQFKGWRNNKTLAKTIEKIPMYKKYIVKEIA
jgi:hypothetical protein